jgi:hypothetical protein
LIACLIDDGNQRLKLERVCVVVVVFLGVREDERRELNILLLCRERKKNESQHMWSCV